MTDWENSAWAFFNISEQRPLRVFLSTYGLDSDFLTTELLPLLLNIGATRETSEWYLEMEKALNDCPVDVAVDSRSWGNGTRNVAFQSLGGCVHPVHVAQGSQHAKLWLAEYEKFVRIAIGSANLTKDAFCNQIQYLWVVKLEKRPLKPTSESNESIQRLQEFLSQLGEIGSSRQSTDNKNRIVNENGLEIGKKTRPLNTVTKAWCRLLDSVTWPDEVKLIPVIPSGVWDGDTVWNYIQQSLPKNRTYHLDIQVFSVGELTQQFIEEFRGAFQAKKSINLFWPEEATLPPRWKDMQLSKSAQDQWTAARGSLFPLEFEPNYVSNAQARLPHGKIYAGYVNDDQEYYDWLVLGSSNLSETAWEHSFELNVLIKGSDLSIPLNYNRYGEQIIPFCQSSSQTANTSNSWLEAWETRQGVEVFLYGKRLDNCTIEVLDASGQVLSRIDLSEWEIGAVQLIACAGKNARRIMVIPAPSDHRPLECEITPILDSYLGKISNSGKSALQLRHEWNLRRYGWNPELCRPGPYRVDWIESGMNLFRIIDRWRKDGREQADRDVLKAAFDFFASQRTQTEEQVGFSMAAEEITKW